MKSQASQINEPTDVIKHIYTAYLDTQIRNTSIFIYT